MNSISTGFKLELFGMAIIFTATAWTFFLGDAATHMYLDASFYRIDEKLNTIWSTISSQYASSELNDSNAIYRGQVLLFAFLLIGTEGVKGKRKKVTEGMAQS